MLRNDDAHFPHHEPVILSEAHFSGVEGPASGHVGPKQNA
jgi:hypothetical protein